MDRTVLLRHIRRTHFAPGDLALALAQARAIARHLYENGASRVIGIGSAFDDERAFTARSDIDLVVEGIHPNVFYRVSAQAEDLTSFELDLFPLECATASLRRVVESRGVAL